MSAADAAPSVSSPVTNDKPVDKPVNKPKPCCVCKEEKAKRDECMLFSETGEEKCQPQILAYKKCMAGFGFNI